MCAHKKKMLLVFLFAYIFYFCPAASISHFLTAAYKCFEFFFIQRNSFPLVFYLSFWLFLCYPRRADVRWRNNQIFCLIDGFPISLYAMGLRRARSLLQDFVSYTKSQPKFKQMIISNKLNCFKQAELKKIPWVTLLKTSSPLDNIHVLTRQNWQNVDQGSWKTIKKFYYKVRYEIFLRKCDSLLYYKVQWTV